MRPLSLAALPLLSLSLISACASDGVVDELAGETPADEALDGKADGALDGTYTYFAIRGDTRKCTSPYCGGYFIERANRTTTVCHDGTIAEACYTPELDWSESGLSEETRGRLRVAAARGVFESAGITALVRGRFAATGTGEVGQELGRFIITEAWVNDSEAVTSGVLVKVKDAGVRCVTAPCPSSRERALNTSREAMIAGIDYSGANLSDEVIEALGLELFEPSGIIIAGDRYTVTENGAHEKGRTATAAFRRLKNVGDGPCFVGGCSGQLCADQPGAVSTCEWQDSYACYAAATCERQPDGACGWTPTSELNACLAGY